MVWSYSDVNNASAQNKESVSAKRRFLQAQTMYDGMNNEQEGMYKRRHRPLKPSEGIVKESHEVTDDARPVQPATLDLPTFRERKRTEI